MIRLTIWYENVQEKGIPDKNIFPNSFTEEEEKNFSEFLARSSAEIKKAYPDGLGQTLKKHFETKDDIAVNLVTLDMPECEITDAFLMIPMYLCGGAISPSTLFLTGWQKKSRSVSIRGWDLSPFIPRISANRSPVCLGQDARSDGGKEISNVYGRLLQPTRSPGEFRRYLNWKQKKCTVNFLIFPNLMM